jgi:hypothetical protein
MERYKLITLVDITRSGASRSETDKIKIGQQANFNSLIQTIGLRSNIEWSNDPVKDTGRLPVGEQGKAVHWIWEFTTERDDVFKEGNNKVLLLLKDLHGVPIVDLLENSADLSPPAFQTSSDHQNTWVEII